MRASRIPRPCWSPDPHSHGCPNGPHLPQLPDPVPSFPGVASSSVSKFFHPHPQPPSPQPGPIPWPAPAPSGSGLPCFSVLTHVSVLLSLWNSPQHLSGFRVLLITVNASPLVAQGLYLPRKPRAPASGWLPAPDPRAALGGAERGSAALAVGETAVCAGGLARLRACCVCVCVRVLH